MTETLCSRLIDALLAAGIPAFPEYPGRLPPIPDAPGFVTVSAEQEETGEPVLLPQNGTAVPVLIRLRVRSHACTWEDLRAVSGRAEQCICTVLSELRLDVRKTVRGEITYQKTLDRLVQEYLVMIRGMLFSEEDDDAD